jgi:small-conductance mechanosensitive channel
MIKHLAIFITLGAVAVSVWVANLHYQDIELDKFFYTALTMAVFYLVFRILLEGAVARRIRDSKARYSFRKTMHILFLVLSFIVILRIWIINPQALLVAYGLVAAGIAIALQDVFKNFAGALAILLTSIYRVGDRIEVNSKYGDVIDIGLFYTTLLEIREWVDGDQATGRLSVIPNGLALSNAINNYTKDHSFIWDEINIPITYQSDWQKAINTITQITKEESKKATAKAEQEIRKLEDRYYLSKRNIESATFVTLTDNWIMLHARYITDVRERRIIQNQLSQRILSAFAKEKDIHIASTSLTINTGVGDVLQND